MARQCERLMQVGCAEGEGKVKHLLTHGQVRIECRKGSFRLVSLLVQILILKAARTALRGGLVQHTG
jgi:hypothetical protein